MLKFKPKDLKPRELNSPTIRTPLWTKVQVVLLFALLGLNILALNKEPKYLVASTNQLTEATPGKEKAELGRLFVKKILPLLFWYTQNPPAELGVKAEDTYVFDGLKIWIPNAEASYALAGNLQTVFLKGLVKEHYAKIKSLGATSCVLYPLIVTTPQFVGNRQWQNYFAGEEFFYNEKQQLISKEDYKVKVTLLEVDPPDKPLGGKSAVDQVVYQARLTGFAIASIEQAPEVFR